MKSSVRASQNEGQPNRLAGLYTCFKILFITNLTVLLLIPVLFMVASEDNHYYQKPFYSLLSQNRHLQSLNNQVASQIVEGSPNNLINLFSMHLNKTRTTPLSQKQSMKRWQNLKEVAEFLGYQLNLQGKPTVTRLIKYPSENISSTSNKDTAKQLAKKAYNLDTQSNIVLYLKKKITKMLTNIINRLKWKMQNKPEVLTYIKNYIISLVKEEGAKKVWIVVLNPQNQEYHHHSTFLKKISEWRESHKEDQMIIVSRIPIDSSNKITCLEINIQKEDILSQLSNVSESQKKLLELPFKVLNPARVYSHLIEKYDGSLSKVSKFLQSCHQSILCPHTYNLLRERIIKQYNLENEADNAPEGICQIDSGSIINLKDEEFRKQFKQLIDSLRIGDLKQFKRDLSNYLHLIIADFCSQQRNNQLKVDSLKEQFDINQIEKKEEIHKPIKEKKKKQTQAKKNKKEQKKIQKTKPEEKQKVKIPTIPKPKAQQETKVKKQPKDKKKFTQKVEAAKKRHINKLKEEAQKPTKTQSEPSPSNSIQGNPIPQESEKELNSNGPKVEASGSSNEIISSTQEPVEPEFIAVPQERTQTNQEEVEKVQPQIETQDQPIIQPIQTLQDLTGQPLIINQHVIQKSSEDEQTCNKDADRKSCQVDKEEPPAQPSQLVEEVQQ